MFDNDVAKWRSSEIRRVSDGRSDWSHCGVLIAAEILQNVHAPAAQWNVFETPSHITSNESAIEASRAAIRVGRYDQLPSSTFDVMADAWTIYVAVEKTTRRTQRALAIEIIDPYEPFDCDHLFATPYLVAIGELTRLKLTCSLDLRQTGLWFADLD